MPRNENDGKSRRRLSELLKRPRMKNVVQMKRGNGWDDDGGPGKLKLQIEGEAVAS